MVAALQSIVRVTALTAVLLVIGAIGLGRLVPEPSLRSIGHSYLVGLGYTNHGTDCDPVVLDARSGELHVLPMPDGERIDLVRGSPWADRAGRIQLVGRWQRTHGDGIHFGLARMSYPDGAIRDRVGLEVFPVSPPCWGGDLSARVLFVAGNGELYRYDFERHEREGGPPGEALAAVRWRTGPPGDSQPLFYDVCRPDELAGRGLLVASLAVRRIDAERGKQRYEAPSLWWLRLDPEDREIVACGQLVPPDPDEPVRHDPSLGRGPDGTLWLTFMGQRLSERDFTLRLARVRLDLGTSAPSLTAGPPVAVITGCMPAPAVFDGDGHLTCIVDGGDRPVARSIPLDDGMGRAVAAAIIGTATATGF